jgi:hypothetical protein
MPKMSTKPQFRTEAISEHVNGTSVPENVKPYLFTINMACGIIP